MSDPAEVVYLLCKLFNYDIVYLSNKFLVGGECAELYNILTLMCVCTHLNDQMLAKHSNKTITYFARFARYLISSINCYL